MEDIKLKFPNLRSKVNSLRPFIKDRNFTATQVLEMFEQLVIECIEQALSTSDESVKQDQIIRKFAPIRLDTVNEDRDVKAHLYMGKPTGPNYNLDFPPMESDTEKEAIEWAYQEDQYATWMIVPIIRFN